MSDFGSKHSLTKQDVGFIEDEDANKKMRLSSSDELLTSNDLRLFQKDVLVRNLKEYKLKYYALEKTIQLSQDVKNLKEYYEDLIHKLNRLNSPVTQRVMGKKPATEDEIKPSDPVEETKQIEDNRVLDEGKSLKADIDILASNTELIDLNMKIENLENKLRLINEELCTKTNTIDSLNDDIVKKDALLKQTDILQLELDSNKRQFEALKAEHHNLLNKLNSLQLGGGSKTVEVTTTKFDEVLKAINENLLGDLKNLQSSIARIRAERDKLKSEMSILKSQETSLDVIKNIDAQVLGIKETIKTFEIKYASIPNDNVLLEELKSIEIAYNELANSKLDELSKTLLDKQKHNHLVLEFEKLKEKHVSANRYIQDMKLQIETLKKIKTKSDDVIADFNIRDHVIKGKVANLEKKIELSSMLEKQRELDEKILITESETLKKQVDLLKKAIEAKTNEMVATKKELDNSNNRLNETNRKVEDLEFNLTKQTEKFQSLVKKLKEASEKLKNPVVINNLLEANINENTPEVGTKLQDQLTNFKQLVYCPLCTNNFKDQMIKNCGHTFCENCIKERLNARMRKCPSCNLPFGLTDVLDIVL